MSAHDQTIGAIVSPSERAFLVEALDLLMRERANALRIASVVAEGRGDRVPEVHDFGLDAILRLRRKVAGLSSVDPPVTMRDTPQWSKDDKNVNAVDNRSIGSSTYRMEK
ncbi:hypothetical protein C0Z16_21950 [Paraburkholderia rhynchosiae]|uniref:Uncharacterized protein n=1 Tax=Paraburkholderia rhynchosiae TaxID=487049 RepID=A0ABX4V0V6_9BURK|nr:hypothetical protein C0Z16_21950 [Paraburkholderia rhynchosiae]